MDQKKILIVDDDVETCIALNIRLRASGFETVVAQEGLGAISAALHERPDLVLLDLGLPAGDGYEVLRTMKANSALATIPIVVLSARDPEANRERTLTAGAAAYLQKPTDGEAVVAAVREHLTPTPEIGPGTGRTALVVDDDEDSRTALGARLRAGGYTPVFATDAISAMTAAKRERPDVILLDLNLPAGGGFLVMQRLRAFPALAMVPVIVVSGRDGPSDRESSLEQGARAYLRKPVEGQTLMDAVKEAM
jgi:DNA-binding response OmpR family regulator